MPFALTHAPVTVHCFKTLGWECDVWEGNNITSSQMQSFLAKAMVYKVKPLQTHRKLEKNDVR
jgi:hypothetical protein